MISGGHPPENLEPGGNVPHPPGADGHAFEYYYSQWNQGRCKLPNALHTFLEHFVLQTSPYRNKARVRQVSHEESLRWKIKKIGTYVYGFFPVKSYPPSLTPKQVHLHLCLHLPGPHPSKLYCSHGRLYLQSALPLAQIPWGISACGLELMFVSAKVCSTPNFHNNNK